MPKQITENDLVPVLEALQALPQGGASLDAIEKKLTYKIARRTLQRRLALLVRHGRIKTEGEGRATCYHLAAIIEDEKTRSASLKQEVSRDIYVPLSTKSERIKKFVRLPIHSRRPVGYDRTFLDTYLPNKSFYLPKSMRQHLAIQGSSSGNKLPAGTYARKVYNRLLIDLSWNSSRLEGNTYSLLETQRLLQLGEEAQGKDAREAQMILNHKAAIELLVEEATEIGFNRYTILNLHALLSDNLLADPSAGGRLRAIPVGIGASVFRPLEVPQLIEECFQEILDKASAIEDPFEQSFFVMVHLPYLQPFEDVNKRVSRLAANIPLIKKNYCPLSFIDVPERAYVDGILGIYELNQIELLRDVFVWAYERSCARFSAIRQSLGEPDLFRQRHRQILIDTIARVVRAAGDEKAASSIIQNLVQKSAPPGDHTKLFEIIEAELRNLHEGNIARYNLRPSEFALWAKRRGTA